MNVLDVTSLLWNRNNGTRLRPVFFMNNIVEQHEMGRPKFGSHPERDSFLHLTAAAATPNEFTLQRWRIKRRSPAGITFARTLTETAVL